MSKAAQRLWEVDHPYYCNQGNYFDNGCGEKYTTWADFYSEMGGSDPDMNLLFRWDWQECEYDGDEHDDDCDLGKNCPRRRCASDHNYRGGELLLFWMGQRKGLFFYSVVQVCRADEPLVRAWLQGRLAHIMKLWAPLAPAKSPSGAA